MISQLAWKQDDSVWVDHGPFPTLEALLEEQHSKGHIIETNSPWNSPFCLKKTGKDKWRLFHNLRKINEVIEEMAAQPAFTIHADPGLETSNQHQSLPF